ncbi:MAG: hypothetical protein LUE96_09940 [Lachnospiraceae bacterium]|nr:hypothetical protein [Lachnospiraceae bacterium]
MERKSNISVWQLGLFEGFDRDIMVMQRDEQEVFDDAIHVFFEREYYDAYVSKAVKYGSHRYAYHEDKLGEVVNQIFDEGIPGLVLHMQTDPKAPKNQLGDEKYISAGDLIGCREIADSYHLLYTTSIDRCVREKAVAGLWMRYVYIIGQLPDMRKKPAAGEKQVFELMTMKRKNDGGNATAQDFDYESLKVFLTAESAMRYNPDKKPVGKYKLSMLAQLVRGRLKVIIEPHRSYWLEFDPVGLELSEYLDIPQYNEEMAQARIREYADMERIYILLNPLHSDYGASVGNPFLLKRDDKNIMLYLFEKYDDAVSYVLQNQNLLPVFDSVFPIGVLEAGKPLYRLETLITLADRLGVTMVCLDADTKNAIAGNIQYFKTTAGYDKNMEELLSAEDLEKVMRRENGEDKYRLPIIPFYDRHNDYAVSEERRAELIAHIGENADAGLSYMAELTVPELMVIMNETAKRFDKARSDNDEDAKRMYSRMMNRFTVPLTEALCEKPYIYTLKEKDGDFTLKNNLVYLIVTDRFEAGRRGEGRLMPAGIDNAQFMEKLCAKAKVAVLTDGPNTVCLMDTRLMSEAAKQWKKSEALREELLIYMTQGCGLEYDKAVCCYKKLKSDKDVFVEFASSVRNGEFPPMGMLEIDGNTAKTLADRNGWSMRQAYDEILAMKERM